MADINLDYTAGEINESVGLRHSHTNKAELDKISEIDGEFSYDGTIIDGDMKKADYDPLIPNTASADNQLTTEAFVNSSIEQMAANRVTYNAAGDGFPTRASLVNATVVYFQGLPYTPDAHDYAVVISDEGAPNPFTYGQTRMEWDGSIWTYAYGINDKPFTAAEVAAIDSGITAALVTQFGNKQNGITGVTTTPAPILVAPTVTGAQPGTKAQDSFVDNISRAYTSLAAADSGWYRFAGYSNDLPASGVMSSVINMYWAGTAHGIIDVDFSCVYGVQRNLNQLKASITSSSNISITKIRFVTNSQGSTSSLQGYLEFYYTKVPAISGGLYINAYRNKNVNFYNTLELGSIPSGFTAEELTFTPGIGTNQQLFSHTPSGTPPLVVTSNALVSNLNAEYFGGAKAPSALPSATGTYTLKSVNGVLTWVADA